MERELGTGRAWQGQERGVRQGRAWCDGQEAGLLSQDTGKQTRILSVRFACQSWEEMAVGEMARERSSSNSPGTVLQGQMEAGPEGSESQGIVKLTGCGWQEEVGARVSASPVWKKPA